MPCVPCRTRCQVPMVTDTNGAQRARHSLGRRPDLRRRWLALLAVALLLAGVGQALLVWPPEPNRLPTEIVAALRPIWPHSGAVLSALVLFLASGLAFAAATRRLAPCMPGLRVTPTGAQADRFSLAGLRLGRPPWPLAAEWAGVMLLLALFVWLSTFDALTWRFASIGDEHAFYNIAYELAQGTFNRNLFSQRGAYDLHPVLGSYVDALIMRVIGIGGFGWKTATVLQAAAALGLTYLLGRILYGRVVAFVALATLATSHYLLGFAHIGYNNLQPLLPTLGALVLFVLAFKARHPLVLVASGVCAGLGWYTFYSSRATIVILLLSTLLIVPPRVWTRFLVPLVAGFAIMVAPLVLVNGPETITGMLIRTGAASNEVVANRDLLLVYNVFRTLTAFNYNTRVSHYTSGSLAEPFTAALYVLGAAWAVWSWRDVRSRLLLVWLGVALAATGVVSQYDFVTITRLHFALPAVALLAAVAVERTIAAIRGLAPARAGMALTVLCTAGVMSVMAGSNLYRWFVVSPRIVPTTPDTVAVRILEDPRCQSAPNPPQVIARQQSGALMAALRWYTPLTPPVMTSYPANADELRQLVASRCVILYRPDEPEAQDVLRQFAAVQPPIVPTIETDLTGQIRLWAVYPTASGASGNAAPAPLAATPRPAGIPAPAQQVLEPRGLAVDRQGFVYVADPQAGTVHKLDSGGSPVAQIGAPGDAAEQLKEPFEVAVDAQGRIYVLDSERARVQRFLPDGAHDATLLGQVGMFRPRGLWISPDQFLYIADTGKNRVVKASLQGDVVQVWDGMAEPTDVIVDRNGDLVVAEPTAQRLRRLRPDGSVVATRTLAPTNTRDAAHLDVTPAGQFVIADPGAREVAVLGADLTTQVSLVTRGAGWQLPIAVASSPNGGFWVSDAATRRVEYVAASQR